MKINNEVKVNVRFLRQIRLAGTVVTWAGLLLHNWSLFGLGVFVWVGTYVYLADKIEKALFEPVEVKDDEEKED